MCTRNKKTVTIAEAAEMLGISRASAYAAASSGELPTIRIGGRLLVPTALLNQMLGLDRPSGNDDVPPK